MDPTLTDSGLERSPLSFTDEVGTLFFAGDRVIRGIRPEAAADVEALLAADWLRALSDRGLIVAARRCEMELPGYALAIEHPRLPVVTYPYEWSYGMLRDAARLILELNEQLNLHGWELKDCHAYNVVFDGGKPVYVDFGSLQRRTGGRGWAAYHQYRCAYDYPLEMWRAGGEVLAKSLIAANALVREVDYFLYKSKCLRWGGLAVAERWSKAWTHYRLLSQYPDAKILARMPRGVGKLLVALKRRGLLPAQQVPYGALRRRLRRRRRNVGSVWGGYQTEGRNAVSSPRFNRIVALLRELGVRSSIELGGNQGLLSQRLLKEQVVDRAICTDFDELAIDRSHERADGQEPRPSLAVLDFVQPTIARFGLHPSLRLRGEVALVLAVSHHVLLTQRMPVELMMKALEAYASRFVLVEFMPLGLWTGRGPAPPVPAWYHQDMFERAMRDRFDDVAFERLEENRVLFWGRVREDKGKVG